MKSVQRWDREGRLIPVGRTVTNRRYYTADQIAQFRQEVQPSGPRQRIVYCRVSSQSQRPDLNKQRRALEEFCVARGFTNVELVEEIGGGMKFGCKQFLALMDAVDARRVEILIVAHKDRLTRFGYEWVAHFCQQHACEILVLNQEHLSPKEATFMASVTAIPQGGERLHPYYLNRRKSRAF